MGALSEGIVGVSVNDAFAIIVAAREGRRWGEAEICGGQMHEKAT
jgi:hypothetical protein